MLQHIITTKKLKKLKNKSLTDNVWYVKAIRKTAGGSVSWIIYAIRVRVCPGSGGQVVIVAIVHQRISENEECPCLSSTASTSTEQA